MRRRPEKLLMAILVKGEKFHRWNISSEFKNVLNISRVWQIAFRYRFEAFHAATCVGCPPFRWPIKGWNVAPRCLWTLMYPVGILVNSKYVIISSRTFRIYIFRNYSSIYSLILSFVDESNGNLNLYEELQKKRSLWIFNWNDIFK